MTVCCREHRYQATKIEVEALCGNYCLKLLQDSEALLEVSTFTYLSSWYNSFLAELQSKYWRIIGTTLDYHIILDFTGDKYESNLRSSRHPTNSMMPPSYLFHSTQDSDQPLEEEAQEQEHLLQVSLTVHPTPLLLHSSWHIPHPSCKIYYSMFHRTLWLDMYISCVVG